MNQLQHVHCLSSGKSLIMCIIIYVFNPPIDFFSGQAKLQQILCWTPEYSCTSFQETVLILVPKLYVALKIRIHFILIVDNCIDQK